MAERIEIATQLTADALRAAARKEGNRRAALRLMAIANELDGYEREEAARLAGMSDQALRDAIKRFQCEAHGRTQTTGHARAGRAASPQSRSARSRTRCSQAPTSRRTGSERYAGGSSEVFGAATNQ
jgi:hypothetical protein